MMSNCISIILHSIKNSVWVSKICLLCKLYFQYRIFLHIDFHKLLNFFAYTITFAYIKQEIAYTITLNNRAVGTIYLKRRHLRDFSSTRLFFFFMLTHWMRVGTFKENFLSKQKLKDDLNFQDICWNNQRIQISSSYYIIRLSSIDRYNRPHHELVEVLSMTDQTKVW